jgi:hypothetical protein
LLEGTPDSSSIADAAQAFGLIVESAPSPELELWPENVAPVRLFDMMQTQWRVGMSGPIGLDYTALPARFRPGSGTRRDRAVFNGLQVMEAEALRWYAEQRADP